MDQGSTKRGRRKLAVGSWLLLLCLLPIAYCLFPVVLLATDTATLRPTADGSLDSASFTNGTTACNLAACYLNVDEASGSSCPSTLVAGDGATTIVTSATNGAKQSFAVDVSSLPDGNQIQTVTVYTCAARGQTGDSARLLAMVAGSEVDCSTTFAPGSSYAAYNCAIPISPAVTKGAGTTIEIGVAMAANKTINFSTFAAVVTHSVPGGRKAQTIVAETRFQDSGVGIQGADARPEVVETSLRMYARKARANFRIQNSQFRLAFPSFAEMATHHSHFTISLSAHTLLDTGGSYVE